MSLRELTKEAEEEVKEEFVLFVSVIKWVFLAAFIGSVVGLSTAFFIKALNLGIEFGQGFQGYYFALPFALLASTLLVKYLAPDAEGHGTEKVIEAVNRNNGRIKPKVAPVKLLATVVTISAGGSAGKEGPAAQIGATLASLFASLVRFDDVDRKKIVICGISAGFSSIFGTPIAGAIFGVEVLMVGGILYEVLLPSFISGIVAYHVSSSLGVTYFSQPLAFVPAFSSTFFIDVVGAGIFFGFCSLILIETMEVLKKIYSMIRLPQEVKAFTGGLVIVALTMAFSTEYLGLGLGTISSCLDGEPVDDPYAFLVKTLFTGLTLSFGGSGGIVTPIFFVGATAGNVFAQYTLLDLATFSAIGLVAVLAGAANTPIAASILAVELFGPEISPYAAIACVVSFLISGHRSVYPSQLLAMKKSSSIEVDLGKEIDTAEHHIKIREGKLISTVSKRIKRR